jgi:hypothetical protein
VTAMVAVFLIFAMFLILGAAVLAGGQVWLGVHAHRKQKEAGLWGPPPVRQDSRH